MAKNRMTIHQELLLVFACFFAFLAFAPFIFILIAEWNSHV